MDREIPSAKGLLRWATVVVVALGLATASCGSDEGAPTPGADSTPTAAASGTEPTDGRLTTKNGEIVTDYGDRRDRIAAVRTLDRLQRDFRAARLTPACAKINDFALNQFTPSGTSEDTPCPRKLAAYAAQRARRGERPQRLRLLWVRSYTVQAGIWVEDRRGRRLRIQMTSEADGSWHFDLGAMKRPDILAAKLVGAGTYPKR